MTDKRLDETVIEDVWRGFLERGDAEQHLRQRRIFRLLPTDPRCKFCNAPFRGAGAAVVRAVYGKRPSELNPRICNVCESFAEEHQGGAEREAVRLTRNNGSFWYQPRSAVQVH